MFTDIERFTETTERLGDAAAHRLLMTHNILVRSRVAAHNGRELKTTGDGFLVIFPSVVQALRCASAIQTELADHNERHDETISVRIGVHAGGVIRTEDDVHGRNVNVAARIAELAHGGEILVSGVVRSLADDRFRFDDGRAEALAGIAGEQVVHALRWEPVRQSV
jgi:class 3 adenylate cyclase